MDQPQIVPHHPSERGDELDLIGLWKVLVEYKLLIIVFTTLTTLGATYYASTLPTIYKAEVLMIPASGGASGGLSKKLGGLANLAGVSLGGGSAAGVDADQALARLKTRKFLINHIQEKNLKPVLFANQWNKAEKRWINQEPSDIDAFELLSSLLTVEHHKNGLISLFVEWRNKSSLNKLAGIANDVVSSINFRAKLRAIQEARNSILFLEKELERTNLISSQTVLYNLIEQQMGKIMMANIKDEFVFKVIDPAIIPRRAEDKPKTMIILIGIALGIFLGSFLAISINYFKEELQKTTEKSSA
jgi:capsular polysaccharide biosynthesis protein